MARAFVQISEKGPRSNKFGYPWSKLKPANGNLPLLHSSPRSSRIPNQNRRQIEADNAASYRRADCQKCLRTVNNNVPLRNDTKNMKRNALKIEQK